jgi:hypothetical protein
MWQSPKMTVKDKKAKNLNFLKFKFGFLNGAGSCPWPLLGLRSCRFSDSKKRKKAQICFFTFGNNPNPNLNRDKNVVFFQT